MTMRWITGALLALLVLVQVDLWFSRNGMFHVRGLGGQLEEVRDQIDAAKAAMNRCKPRSRTFVKAWKWSRRRRVPNWGWSSAMRSTSRSRHGADA
jgi:hypothetical protein